jgi:hypothetical protein
MLVVLVTQEMSDPRVTQETQEQMDLLAQVEPLERLGLQEMPVTQDHLETPEQAVTLELVEQAELVELVETAELVLIQDKMLLQLGLTEVARVVSAAT